MRLDHVSYAVGPDGLARTAGRLSQLLGSPFVDGGVHPRFGTRNMVLPLAGRQYLELVEVLDHPASDKAPFGQAVRARSKAGGGWLGWVIAVDDITLVEKRLERESVVGSRHRPDGVELRWRQVGVKGLQSDPQLPFFIEWESDPALHPAAVSDTGVALDSLDIAGDPSRVAAWLDAPPSLVVDDVELNWVAPEGSPGLIAVTFTTRRGVVRI
jgi:Glyoxalase-like domain